MNSSISDFKNKGIVRIEYPLGVRTIIKEAVEAWKIFCKLPLHVKQSLPYSDASTGVGYEFKNGSGFNGDRKENFDFALRGTEWLSKYEEKIPKEARDFLHKAEQAVVAIQHMIHDFAISIESEYKFRDFHTEIIDSDELFFIRFIHYEGKRKAGEETAAAHIDQSAFTLHLHESAPGFQYLTYDTKKWTDVSFAGKDTVIIPSMQIQLRSENKIKATCHRVVATSKTARIGRYSAVCFVQLRWTKKYNKEKYGRLQEKEPGFNYEINDQKFSEMFR